MSGKVDPRQLATMLRADAQKMGISVEELIRRIMGGGQNVVGHLGGGTIPQGPTFISAEGGGVWNNIEPEQHEPMDDFEELAQRHAQFLEEAEGDDLARDVLLRNHVAGQAAAQAPFHNPNPPSISGAQLGMQLPVSSGQDPPTAAYWVGDTDSEVRTVVVTLSALAQFNASMNFGANPTPLRPFAKILFGNRAYAYELTCDIGVGTVAVVTGSMVTVKVGLPAALATFNPITQQIAASLSFHNTMRTTNLINTFYADANNNQARQINIPLFAQSFSVWRPSTATAINGIEILDSNGAVVTQVDLAANTQMTQPIPIPGDGVQVSLPGLGVSGTARVIFNLAM